MFTCFSFDFLRQIAKRGTRKAVTARGIVNDETRRNQVKIEIYILESMHSVVEDTINIW